MSEFLSWQTTWTKIIEANERDVAEFNRSGHELTVSRFSSVLMSSDEIFLGVQVVSKNGPARLKLWSNIQTLAVKSGKRRSYLH